MVRIKVKDELESDVNCTARAFTDPFTQVPVETVYELQNRNVIRVTKSQGSIDDYVFVILTLDDMSHENSASYAGAFFDCCCSSS